MIDYSRNPQGDVIWSCASHHSIIRISLNHFLEIVAHTATEQEFRTRLYKECELERVEGHKIAAATNG